VSLRGLDWTDYTGSELAINRSIWMSVVNLPKNAGPAGIPCR